MQTGANGLALIKRFEGFYSKPYRDPIGIPTIGYGFTYYLPDHRKVSLNDAAITLAQGEKMLIAILKGYEQDVLRLVKKPLRQNQFDALVSFTFNLGATNLGQSKLLKKVNVHPDDPSIGLEFLRWNRAAGQVFEGLTRRRKAESDLYFNR